MRKPVVPLIWQAPPPPERHPLNRAAIVRAAITVADGGGSQALTMSAVGRELGDYTAMALYRYVQSKDGLIDLMLDQVVAEIPLPDRSTGDWRAQLRRIALDSWAMAHRHTWYAQLVHTRPPLGPNTLRRTESALETLAATGLDLAEALSYLALLDRYVYSTVVATAEEGAMMRRYVLGDDAALSAAVQELRQSVADGGQYPLLARWMVKPAGPTPEQQFIRGLDFLLDGIAARSTPVPRPSRHVERSGQRERRQ